MPNVDLDPNGIEITLHDDTRIGVRLGDNLSPHDPEVETDLRKMLTGIVPDIDAMIDGLKTSA